MHVIMAITLGVVSVAFVAFGVLGTDAMAGRRRWRKKYERAGEELAVANRKKAEVEADLDAEKKARKADAAKAAKDHAATLAELDQADRSHKQALADLAVAAQKAEAAAAEKDRMLRVKDEAIDARDDKLAFLVEWIDSDIRPMIRARRGS